MSESKKLLFTRCEKTEVNLRKYRILGGIFRVDILYQPPQPKDLGKDTYLTTREFMYMSLSLFTLIQQLFNNYLYRQFNKV